MKISRKKKEETRRKILAKAERLFIRDGYGETTTRGIAKASGIAVGTLFNYFPTKEELAMTLVADVLSQGREDYRRRRTGDEECAEELFLLVTSELRRLRPFRKFVGPVFESTMSLFSGGRSCEMGDRVRAEHLAEVKHIVESSSYSSAPVFILMNLYWSLYLGILAYWSADDSVHQAETLVLIDYAFRIFIRTINGPTPDKERQDVTQ